MKTRFVLSLAVVLVLTIFVSGGANAGSIGKACGGFIGLPCDTGQFCQHKTGQCGLFDMTGTCTKIPQICSRIYLPVCGCDGKTYSNDCEREHATVSKLHNGKCS